VPYGDYTAPVYKGDTLIIKSRNAVVIVADLVDQIKSLITDKTAITTEVILDTYTGNGATVGDYVLNLKCTDGNSNFVDLSFTVRVIDDLAPRFVYDGTLFIDNTTDLTKEQIVNILKRVGMLPNVQLAVSFDSPYFADTTQTGDYTMSMDYSSPTGQTGTLNFTLAVLADDPSVIDIPVNTFWRSVGVFFSSYWVYGVLITIAGFVGYCFLVSSGKIKRSRYRRY
jgi:hypothetical protein